MVELTDQIIEAYCNEQLTPEEVREFEIEMKSNVALQDEVRAMLTTLSALKEIRAEELLQRLSTLTSNDKVRKLNPPIQWIRWAAAILILAIVGYFIFEQLNKLTPEDIFLAYFEPYPNVIDPGTRGEDRVVSIGLAQYEAAEYNSAFMSLKEVVENNPKDLESAFYFGMSALLIEQNKIAQDELDKVASSESKLAIQAKWYLSLLALKTNQIDLAKETLQEIIDGKSSYSVKASKIMKQI